MRKCLLAVILILSCNIQTASADCLDQYYQKVERAYDGVPQVCGYTGVLGMGVIIMAAADPIFGLPVLGYTTVCVVALAKRVMNYERIAVSLGGYNSATVGYGPGQLHVIHAFGSTTDLSYPKVMKKIYKKVRKTSDIKNAKNEAALMNEITAIIKAGNENNDFCKNDHVMNYKEFLNYISERIEKNTP